MNLISGKGETSSRLPAFSLFLPGKLSKLPGPSQALLAQGAETALAGTLRTLQPISLIALLATLVLLFGFQGEQIISQPIIIVLCQLGREPYR